MEEHATPSTRNACAGFCCEGFTLGQLSPEEIAARGRLDPEDRVIADMLVPVGYYRRNPIRVVRGDQEGPVVEVDPATFEGSWFYTCSKFDSGTRSCTDYEARPHMCRSFPNDGPCPFEGCEYAVPYHMVASEYWRGMWVSRGLLLEECAAFARALGVPEPPALKVMEWNEITGGAT